MLLRQGLVNACARLGSALDSRSVKCSTFAARGAASACMRTRPFSAAASEPAQVLKRTALYDLHVRLGGKMVDFAGYAMPVQYPDGIMNSHLHCRTSASLFDVSHMGQVHVYGKDRVDFIESVVVGDIKGLKPEHTRLSVLTNDRGGVLDDLLVTNADSHLYLVINAGCKDADMAYLDAEAARWRANGKDITLDVIDDERSLIALQGPKAMEVLGRHVNADLVYFSFMNSRIMHFDGTPVVVTRCGYTGEDGFEISVPSGKVEAVTETLLGESEVKAAGLGARDSLRLEAGLCLYGHELDPSVTPVEADLTFLIGKRRRAEGGFPGAAVIQDQLKAGVARKRVGLLVEGAPAREHAEVLDATGAQVGEVTSGGFSPSLKRAIAQAYVPTALADSGSKVSVLVRGKQQPATVTKMPFVPTTYYRAPK